MRFDFKHIEQPWLMDMYREYLPDSGFFVEIGMGHTTTDESRKSNFKTIELNASNTIELLTMDWKGIFIEPIPEFCYEASLLMKDSIVKGTVKIVNLGASDQFELCTMYAEETMVPNNQLSYIDGGTKRPYDYPGKKIFCKPTSQILTEMGCPTSIDFMSIDVEGFEDKVLRGLDFNLHKPSVMLIEHVRFSKGTELLIPPEYVLVNKDNINGCWVNKKLIRS